MQITHRTLDEIRSRLPTAGLAEIAKEMGVTHGTLRKIRTGQQDNPVWANVVKIATYIEAPKNQAKLLPPKKGRS